MSNMLQMQKKAEEVSEFIKCFGSPHRLMIFCQLSSGEKSVGQLIDATGIAQTSMSQHLAKLKSEGLVKFRRDHRTLYYSISSPDVQRVMEALHDIYCKDIVNGTAD